jgi:hypothetical protein
MKAHFEAQRWLFLLQKESLKLGHGMQNYSVWKLGKPFSHGSHNKKMRAHMRCEACENGILNFGRL